MDLEGNSLGVVREDRKRQVEAVMEKDFPKFSLFLSYSYVDNSSNDPFFRWKGHFFSAGVEWNLFFGEKK
jgi:outer membrane protein TolC